MPGRHMTVTFAAVALLGCGVGVAAGDGGADGATDVSRDVVSRDHITLPEPGDGAGADASDSVEPPRSNIAHVIIIVQENHTFDTYFGRYCRAPAGSSPTCTDGPDCCERAPDTEPGGHAPTTLDDAENAGYDPNHTQACERSEMNGGAMDHYTTGASCADPRNFAIASDTAVGLYHQYATQYALADRYFQPIIGQSSANDMYFAVAHREFTDNAFKPNSIGQGCTLPAPTTRYNGRTTVADLLLDAGWRFAYYAEGYADMRAAAICPLPPGDCPFHLPTTPCDYDPSDVPFEYYGQFADNPLYMKDLADLRADIMHGTLPNVAFVKLLGYHNEHPGYGTRISDGTAAVSALVDSVLASPYADDTLILVTWDEGGGFYDHVSPPTAVSPVDSEPYGTRVPLLAIGRFARRNNVSHVVLEHSSIVSFLEYNFLGHSGQLGARDAMVNNIGSLLDPAQTGVMIPW